MSARDDYRYELVAGRVIRMSPVGWQHGVIVGRLLGMLVTYLRGRSVGEAVTEVGFTLRTNPDTVRGPDVAFVRQERVPRETLRTFWPGAPDVAMEVMSPDDTPQRDGRQGRRVPFSRRICGRRHRSRRFDRDRAPSRRLALHLAPRRRVGSVRRHTRVPLRGRRYLRLTTASSRGRPRTRRCASAAASRCHGASGAARPSGGLSGPDPHSCHSGRRP